MYKISIYKILQQLILSSTYYEEVVAVYKGLKEVRSVKMDGHSTYIIMMIPDEEINAKPYLRVARAINCSPNIDRQSQVGHDQLQVCMENLTFKQGTKASKDLRIYTYVYIKLLYDPLLIKCGLVSFVMMIKM
jgi:hypothetical protein